MIGFKRIPRKVILLLLAIAVVALIVWLTISANRIKLLPLSEMRIAPMEVSYGAVLQGSAWKPAAQADAEGYVSALTNDRFALSVHMEHGLIKVLDKQSGYIWRSNPDTEALASETVKGTLLSNLKSPFILEYYEEERPQRRVTNALEKDTAVRYVMDGDTLQVSYQFAQLQISLSIQYTLTDQGLKAGIPAQSLQELDRFHVVDISLLPFMGAAPISETDGYLFVPDGPGALIRFDPERALIGGGYNYRVYGNDMANMRFDLFTPREWIRYPVFGIKRGDHAMMGIITEGDFDSSIHANPAGMVSTHHSAYASFLYREEYNQRQNRSGAVVKTFQKEMLKRDRAVEYVFLSGEDADYSGMAHKYRQHLLDTGGLVKRVEPVEHIPLNLLIKGGDAVERFNRMVYVPVTTFPQAEEIVTDLVDSGVPNMLVTYLEWQDGGHDDLQKKFPVEKKLGGKRAAESFVRKMHDYGFKVMFDDDSVVADQESFGITARSNGMRGIDGTVWSEEGKFFMAPELTAGLGGMAIQKLRELGVDGVFQNWFGEIPNSDYHQDRTFHRDESAHLYNEMLQYTQDELGMTSVYEGRVDALKNVDWIHWFGLESSGDYMVDEAVPFFPMVVHGLVAYSSDPGNLRSDDYQDEMLKMIEYGAIPAFEISYDSSRKLKNVAGDFLFSSQYTLWKDRIIAEYEAADQLAAVFDQQMVRHAKKADDVYVTTYEDGTEVTVNYNTGSFEVGKGGGAK